MATPPYRTNCAHCGALTAAEVVVAKGDPQKPESYRRWIACTDCGGGMYVAPPGDRVFPGALPSTDVPGLKPDVRAAWSEARLAFSATAYTACELMCRKILMNIAVDKAGSKPGEAFQDYLDDLDEHRYITAGMREAVDRLRSRGNLATHALDPASKQDAALTIEVTEHLLESVYKFPAMVEAAETAGQESGG